MIDDSHRRTSPPTLPSSPPDATTAAASASPSSCRLSHRIHGPLPVASSRPGSRLQSCATGKADLFVRLHFVGVGVAAAAVVFFSFLHPHLGNIIPPPPPQLTQLHSRTLSPVVLLTRHPCAGRPVHQAREQGRSATNGPQCRRAHHAVPHLVRRRPGRRHRPPRGLHAVDGKPALGPGQRACRLPQGARPPGLRAVLQLWHLAQGG